MEIQRLRQLIADAEKQTAQLDQLRQTLQRMEAADKLGERLFAALTDWKHEGHAWQGLAIVAPGFLCVPPVYIRTEPEARIIRNTVRDLYELNRDTIQNFR